MKTMKLSLLTLLFLLFSCEKNGNDDSNEIITVSEINSEIADELDDNLDAVNEEMISDFNESFDLFDAQASKNKDFSRSYNEATGYWTVKRDIEFTREVTRYRDSKTIVRSDNVDIDVTVDTRFDDENNIAIHFPRLNPDSVVQMTIIRNSDIKLNTEVTVTDSVGNVDRFKSKNRDKTANQNIILTKSDIENVWDMSLTGSKTLDIEISRGDTVKIVNASMSVSTSDLKVKKVRNQLNKHKVRIISGEITRVVTFGNGNTFTILTTHFDCDDITNTDDIKYIRNFYSNGSDVPFKTVTVYCSLSNR